MAPQPALLDETEFDAPYLLHELPGGNLNTDSILWYFMNSPFFDAASNNTALMQQLRNHPDGHSTLMSRRLFEEHLARFPAGLSYFCVAEPQGPGQPYVIQRQFKMLNQETGRPEVQVQGTYYTDGTRIRMAPSLLDVVQLRLLTTATQLQQAYDLSKNLSQFAPGIGHSYLPPSYELPKTASTASRIGSPILAATEQAVLASTAPAAAEPVSQSQPQTQRTTEPTETTETIDAFSDALFLQSLHNTGEYYDEFMDENPLQGEPGAFVFRETYGAVKAREKREEEARQREAEAAEKAVAVANIKPETQSAVNSGAATPKTGIGATPAALDSFGRKQSVAGLPKPKRKKSKGLGTPVTPTAPHPNFPS